jgi:hypothetical protein
MIRRRVINGQTYVLTRRGWRLVMNGYIRTRKGWRKLRRQPSRRQQPAPITATTEIAATAVPEPPRHQWLSVAVRGRRQSARFIGSQVTSRPANPMSLWQPFV